MIEHVRVPVKVIGGEKWGALCYVFSGAHIIVGEGVDRIDAKLSFAGNHRVRQYRFKKNVYWKIPTGVDVDISDVKPADPPRRARRP